MSAPLHLVVAMPARDEEARIARALDAIGRSATVLLRRDASATVTVVVAADGCSDRTAAIARSAGAVVVEIASQQVGAARRAAIAQGLRLRPDTAWIANTDADSRVPPGWLSAQAEAARGTVDLLLGAVRPDPDELSRELLRRWRRAHPATDDHAYVHGANLGIRADVYRSAGGFAEVAVHEDVGLVERCRALGATVRSTARHPVTTSARTVGRTPGGFSGYLNSLGAEY